jgi:truncated hemoglobin YjbI
MQITQTKSKSGGNQTGTWSAFSAAGLSTARKNVAMVNCLFLAAFVLQMQHSGAETKQPILIDSEFTQPEKLQLRFRPLGKYAATTFTSHIRVLFNYSSLIQLESKMDQQLDQFVMDIDKYHFKIDDADLRTIHSTFQIYRQNTKEIFKLFNDLLASLPPVHARQRRQWDIASFVAATAALSLATYNTIQISKLETAIEVQQAKTDLLTDITKLHEQHLHQLQGQMSDIGQEIQCQHLGRTRGRPGRSHCHWRHQLFPNAVLVRLGRMQASWPNVLL